MKKKELLKKIEELEERLLILDDEELSRLEEGYLVGRLEALENRILILEAASSYHYYRYPPIYSCQPTITGDRTGTSSDSSMVNSISGEEVYFTLT